MIPGWTQLLLVALLAVLLFGGRGKIASVMGDFAKGITSFRKGLRDEPDEPQPLPDRTETELEEEAEEDPGYDADEDVNATEADETEKPPAG